MTVSYTGEAYSVGFGVYLRLLFRYRGSVYKMIWSEFLIFGALYTIISLLYRFVIVDPLKLWLELCIISVSRVMHQLPIGFVLGFYVSLIYGRFWKSYLAIPSPNKTAIYLTNYLKGSDENAVLIRRTAIRYVCASFVLAMRAVNIPVRKRFPTVKHICEAGLLTEKEFEAYMRVEEKCKYMTSITPLTWCACVIRDAYDAGKIKSTPGFIDLIKLVDDFRTNCQIVFNYDTVNVPLCYTQAVTFAVYSYFAAALIGYQFITEDRVLLLKQSKVRVPFGQSDMYVPYFAIVQFFIYIGLMKVAEALLNPHGENDDDFEICNMVDKNLNNGNMIVTDMHADLPDLQEDAHWDVGEVVLPHTIASNENEKTRSMYTRLGSVFDMKVSKGAQFVTSLTKKTGSFLGINITASSQRIDENAETNETEASSESAKTTTTNAPDSATETGRSVTKRTQQYLTVDRILVK